MENQHPDQGQRKFWSVMKSMTWKQRLQHIAYYYLKYALIAAFLIYVGVDVAYDSLAPKPEVILSGVVINVQITEDVEYMLGDGAFPHMGGTDTEKQTVKLEPHPIELTDMYAGTNLHTKISAGDYHYCLMDRTGLEKLLSLQVLPDLTQVLTAEQLAVFEGRLSYLKTETETFPVAIDISGTPLAEGCTYEGERLYLGFPVIFEDIPGAVAFMDYLLSQGLLEIQ